MPTDTLAEGRGGESSPGPALDNVAWTTLVDSIVVGECTPFLGAGVAAPHLPSGKALAGALAEKFEFPLNDVGNLPRVTQYLATIYQPAFAKRRVCERILADQEAFRESSGRRFPKNYELLAALNLPLYVTTNYDDFMYQALRAAGRDAQAPICRWNDQLCEEVERYGTTAPTRQSPVVFHLHGALSKEVSILVTEDDYIDFTVSLAERPIKEDPVIPHWVRRGLSRTSLLFIGYSLEDWNFRVLMRHLMKQQKLLRSEQSFSLSVQLSDSGIDDAHRDRAERFLGDYLGTAAIRVHWTPAEPFLEELHERVNEARKLAGTHG
jgi:hypothetical protein